MLLWKCCVAGAEPWSAAGRLPCAPNARAAIRRDDFEASWCPENISATPAPSRRTTAASPGCSHSSASEAVVSASEAVVTLV
ncbi:unnamed protein product [Boreogadus saida]